ncbi:sugar-binding transcriptional regulator [Tessaracoccus sp. OS52]|uniref:sugar-binding transcriptional regulator n=1 Tax=Tessaracoccus sp. OS52 TaxID=2886691 RepID=UPI001D102D2C|nr:sugar-binding transcriptional regulator [Tessaracoccus sp. OS52]MCC2591869.1 sugar-binding transcriptional regulator [Tessaracoccus sp. OS52]
MTSDPLMPRADQLRLMTKVAKLYHELGMKQVDVASTVRISQTRVSRLLRRAEELGLVRTVVTAPPGVNTDVESELERRFGLYEAIVVDDPASGELLAPALGAATATFLQEALGPSDSLGFSSWSATLLASVEALNPGGGQRAKEVVQLVGGRGVTSTQERANRLLGRLAMMTGATPYYLTAPGLLDTPAAVSSLLSDGSLRPVVQAWEHLTIALVGIGGLEPSPFFRASGNAISKADEAELRRKAVVGDILLRYLDVHGEVVDSPLNRRVVGIPLEQFMQIPRRVAVAGGPRKAPAIVGALRGQWINYLVTDFSTAETVLKLTAK